MARRDGTLVASSPNFHESLSLSEAIRRSRSTSLEKYLPNGMILFMRVYASTILVVMTAVVGLNGQTFSIVELPDTQNYAQYYPATFIQQTQWIASEAAARNIRYVSHVGDVVNHGHSAAEWNVADLAMSTLDAADIPYGVTAGNHDITPAGAPGTPYDTTDFLQNFGAGRFADKSWYRGTSPSGMSSWQVFDGGGIQFLTMHIECDTPLRELIWAQGVLDANRDKPVILTTHRYLQDVAEFFLPWGPTPTPSGRYPAAWYAFEGVTPPDGIKSEEFFDWFVRRNPNIFMVQCGHFSEEYRQTSANVDGRLIHEILANYQNLDDGGQGFLRIMNFDLATDLVTVETYSPTLDSHQTTDESAFTLSIDIEHYRELQATVALQDGIRGYAGTRDTWVDENAPNASSGQSTTAVVDPDTTDSASTTARGIALVRFEGLFGDPGIGRIPNGATITRAVLTIQLASDSATPGVNPDFTIHRVLSPWSESDSWTSLGAEPLVGTSFSAAIATFPGMNVPDDDGLRRIDVTAAIQAISAGAVDHGFAILPHSLPGNGDGIAVLTRESANPLLRPRLEVTYASGCGFNSYGIGASPANSLVLSGLGLPVVGGALDYKTYGATNGFITNIISLDQSNMPILGGVGLIDPELIVYFQVSTSPQASVSWHIAIPDEPNLAGLVLYMQAVAPDPTQIEGFLFSNGLRVEIGR